MTNTTIKLTMPTSKFLKLKTLLNNAQAEHAYFPHRNLRDIKPASNQTNISIDLTPQEYENLKGAIAKFNTSEASFYLDLIFDTGQPQFDVIIQAMREEAVKNAAAQQTGLTDLQAVTPADITKAKKAAKPKVRVKAGSNKKVG